LLFISQPKLVEGLAINLVAGFPLVGLALFATVSDRPALSTSFERNFLGGFSPQQAQHNKSKCLGFS
jgi:hypothetical protein